MKVLLLTVALLSFAPRAAAQVPTFQLGHTHDVLAVKFSPDDSQLISYSAGDGQLCLWEVASGRLVWMSETSFIQKGDEHYNLKEFLWSADGKHVITASMNGSFQTWDARTGRILSVADERPAVGLAPERPKRFSVAKEGERFRLTDAKTGETRAVEASPFVGNAYDVSHDGSLFAESGGGGEASIKLTELATGRTRFLSAHPGVVKTVAFSPDGKLLAVAGEDKNIYLFDAAKRALVRVLVGHTKPVNSVAFSPDGKTLLSAAEQGSVKLWDLREGGLVRDITTEGAFFAEHKVAFSPDGNYFLTTGDTVAFTLWDARALRPVRVYKTAEKYEESNGRMTLGYEAVPVSGAAFSRDGRRIFSAHEDGTLRVWDVRGGRQLAAFKIGDQVSFIRRGPDARTVLAAVRKGEGRELRIKLFDVADGRAAFEFDGGETGYVEDLAPSPDGLRFVTSDVSGDVLLWDVTRPKHLRRLENGFSGHDAMAFSPDGRLLAAGGKNQNLMLFDAATGEKLWQLIPSDEPGELEKRLTEEKQRRWVEILQKRARRADEAARDAEVFKRQVYVTFSHYGEMDDPGGQRMVESGEPRKSRARGTADSANAVWLRLHNDSPLPVKIPTLSLYLPNPKCSHALADGRKVLGLCDGMEVSVWFGMAGRDGKPIPSPFDSGAASLLLPKTSVLFAVPLGALKDGNAIRFRFTFQKETEGGRVEDYGESMDLKFDESSLPRGV